MNITMPLEKYQALLRRAGIDFTDCAFDRGEKCAALTEKKCLNCRFFKTKEELAAGREKAYDHVQHLPNRAALVEKYGIWRQE